MARIRYLKPEFYRHERLQALEREHPGRFIMLVFSGLWTQCDKLGHFPWKPNQLKLDILPFLEFDMVESLDVLMKEKFISRYEISGEQYGEIKTFSKHQRISGKEAGAPARYPEPIQGKTRKRLGSVGEAPRSSPDALDLGVKGNGVGEMEIGAHAIEFIEIQKRADTVLDLYPSRAAKDQRPIHKDTAARDCLASKIAAHPDYPWEEHARLAGLNPTPCNALKWAEKMPDEIALKALRGAAPKKSKAKKTSKEPDEVEPLSPEDWARVTAALPWVAP